MRLDGEVGLQQLYIRSRHDSTDARRSPEPAGGHRGRSRTAHLGAAAAELKRSGWCTLLRLEAGRSDSESGSAGPTARSKRGWQISSSRTGLAAGGKRIRANRRGFRTPTAPDGDRAVSGALSRTEELSRRDTSRFLTRQVKTFGGFFQTHDDASARVVYATARVVPWRMRFTSGELIWAWKRRICAVWSKSVGR